MHHETYLHTTRQIMGDGNSTFTPLVLHVEETCYINMDPIHLLLGAWDPWWGAGSHW
jgi:hypothetical protein